MGVVYIQQNLDNMDDKQKHCRIFANKLGRVAYSRVSYTKLLEEAFGVSEAKYQPEVPLSQDLKQILSDSPESY